MDSMGKPPLENVVQTLKLAAIAVVFDQLDYALTLCRNLQEKKVISLERLAEHCNVKYIKLMRDL